MKKNIYILLLLFGLQNGFAIEKDSLNYVKYFKNSDVKANLFDDDCDACGCSASGGSMGFASMLNSNFIGVRYFNQSYKSNDGLYSNSPWYNENFNTIQIWTRIPVAKNIQISALLPYHFHNRESATGKQDISGIGDATVLGMYTIYQTKKDSANLYHALQLGAGIKIPLGKFDAANNGSVNPSYQVGTGSWDYLLASEYVIKRKQLGLNSMLNYVIKTENDKNYRFGNQFNYATTLFYLIEKEAFSLVPQIGVAGEVYEDNYQLNQKVRGTAGDIFMGKLGFEIGKDKFSFGANAMLPINQNLTDGNVKSNYRWSINLNYSL
ncbi:transporter [Flavobacterium sp.]|uniref:transporter n=1 Tax=Flavobacterium sp. TaxID=239 RepID=UPI003F6A213E